jgi:hypothetical protein
MLINSTRGIASSHVEEESSLLRGKIEDQSSLLRRKVEELNRNTLPLIAEAGKLIQESKRLSDLLRSLRRP